jgi:hypothetical protein
LSSQRNSPYEAQQHTLGAEMPQTGYGGRLT